MTTSSVAVTPGSGKIVATNSFTEDAVTKEAQRVVINTSAGVEVDFTAISPVKIDQTTPGTTNAINLNDRTGADALGAVTASPTANTVLGRLKDLLSLIVLGAGANVIGKVGIDQTTPGTTNLVSTAGQGLNPATTITRPANVTAYTANDVVGGAQDLGASGLGAGTVYITGVQLELDITAIPSGMTSFRLYLYNVTPPSAVADNSPWDLPSGDRASFLGYVDLGSPVDLGSTCYCEANGINKQLALSGTHLFGYLVTNGAYTPAANSEVYKITLHTVAV